MRIQLSLFFAGLFVLVSTFVEAGGTYDAKNIEIKDGVRSGRSGKVIFTDHFENPDTWPGVINYRDVLQIDRGAEFDHKKMLVVHREIPHDPGIPEDKDVAWSVTSTRLPMAPEFRGSDYILRITAIASKIITASGYDNESWHSAIRWFDSNGNSLVDVPFIFRAEAVEPKTSENAVPFNLLTNVEFDEKTITGIIPREAAFYEIRIGFDAPNIEAGEFVAVESITLEAIDPVNAYQKPGQFTSDIMRGGDVTWDADVPDGCKIGFQLSTANFLNEQLNEPGDFSEFTGPDGTAETCFEHPFSSSAPWVRYRVFLTPNGHEPPTLKSVTIRGKTDSKWHEGKDTSPPRVRIVGECANPTTNLKAPLVLEVSDDSVICPSTLKIRVDEVDMTGQFTCETQENGSFLLTCTPENARTEGLHRVEVDISDICKNSVTAIKYFLIGESPHTPPVTLREDGVTLIDGKPFFPIGLYGVTEREFNGNNIDEAFRGLKEGGFNFAHSYNMAREDRFLAAAEKYGFKLWSSARFPDERFVEIERHSPAIIAWYLGDDTSYNTKPSELFDYFDSVKAVDPTRITVQADPINSDQYVSNYFPYVQGTDAFLPEIYPVRDDGPESGFKCVAQTIKDIKRCQSDIIAANDGPKAIWAIIQYFQGWGWKRFPTNDELRAMSFGALAAGANGITWYTYGGFVNPEKGTYNYGVTSSPERWHNITTLATQINELTPFLLEPTNPEEQPAITVLNGPQNDPLGGDPVICLLKRHDGQTCLLAVNATPQPVEFLFDFTKMEKEIPEKTNQINASVLFENVDSVTLENGIMTDKLEGFGVRIYCWDQN